MLDKIVYKTDEYLPNLVGKKIVGNIHSQSVAVYENLFAHYDTSGKITPSTSYYYLIDSFADKRIISQCYLNGALFVCVLDNRSYATYDLVWAKLSDLLQNGGVFNSLLTRLSQATALIAKAVTC